MQPVSRMYQDNWMVVTVLNVTACVCRIVDSSVLELFDRIEGDQGQA